MENTSLCEKREGENKNDEELTNVQKKSALTWRKSSETKKSGNQKKDELKKSNFLSTSHARIKWDIIFMIHRCINKTLSQLSLFCLFAHLFKCAKLCRDQSIVIFGFKNSLLELNKLYEGQHNATTWSTKNELSAFMLLWYVNTWLAQNRKTSETCWQKREIFNPYSEKWKIILFLYS